MNRWWLLAGLWLLYTAFGLTATAIAPLVLPIERELGISHAAMGSIMGTWQLVYIFAAMPGGVMLDRLGPNVWHRTPAQASAVLEELEETAKLWLMCNKSPLPLDNASIAELRKWSNPHW